MPISTETDFIRLSQQEFSLIAYDVMAEAFALHKSMGRLFDEEVYKNALAEKIGTAKVEVPVHVSYQNFKKTYFLDLVVAEGAVFELKTVTALNNRHRSQLLNYLLLTELKHGKLVNLRPESVEHEFVNTSLFHSDRKTFTIDDFSYEKTEGFGKTEKMLIEDMLRDWGTGLDLFLYKEAILHFFGKDELSTTPVKMNSHHISNQAVNLCNTHTALVVTTFENEEASYHKHLKLFLNCTTLNAIQWINISKNRLSFITIK